MNTSRCIIVLGMHRSGTSIVSGILHTMGVNMGTRFREPDTHNSTGYFEDLDWRDLNKLIINYDGGTWYNVPNIRYMCAKRQKFEPAIKALVAEKSKSSLWGFKDPRTALTIHLLYQYLPNPQIVYVNRNSDDVVRSLMKRAEARGYYESPEHWYDLCLTYRSRILDFTMKHRVPVYIISYDMLVHPEHTRENIMGLADYVGIPEKEKVNRACAIVKQRL